MKNQYFGDINDYRKYGLLRCLADGLGLSIGVCWMLTADDGGTDGSLCAYLQQEQRWRHHDEELYDQLRQLLDPAVVRTVAQARRWQLVPYAQYYARLLHDEARERADYFERARAVLRGSPLLFFDPDNGIEVPSIPSGRRHASKYLYWCEIESAYAAGHSLLVYQHFPRVERGPFVLGLGREMRRRLPGSQVHAYRTARVVFFLALHPEHARGIAAVDQQLGERWKNEITRALPRQERPAGGW